MNYFVLFDWLRLSKEILRLQQDEKKWVTRESQMDFSAFPRFIDRCIDFYLDQQWQPLKVEARLKCRYVRHEEAYFQLRRLKLEEMSHQPHIVVFHEFMNEAEMELFKALASVR